MVEAAFDCLLDGGYATTTVGAVQARAGVARGTLLHHFPTRSALMDSLAKSRYPGVSTKLNRRPCHSQLSGVPWIEISSGGSLTAYAGKAGVTFN